MGQNKDSVGFKICVTLVLCAMIFAVEARSFHRRVNRKRQVGTGNDDVVNTQQDKKAEASHPLGAGYVQAQSKYFQYAHAPSKDHHEVGHRKGNEHHFTERHERNHPHEGQFKTKVRWGDKHGGYGEHYWDYNHAGGHDDSHDEGSDQHLNYHEDQPSRERRTLTY